MKYLVKVSVDTEYEVEAEDRDDATYEAIVCLREDYGNIFRTDVTEVL